VCVCVCGVLKCVISDMHNIIFIYFIIILSVISDMHNIIFIYFIIILIMMTYI
jgi:hypothetical protein